MTEFYSFPDKDGLSDQHCPHCQGDIAEGSSFDMEPNQVSQELSCSDCEHHWMNIYHLIGYQYL